MNKTLCIGILSIIGAWLINFSFGYIYTIANMVPYLMGYIKTFVDPELHNGHSVWLSAVGLAIQGLTMPLGGFLYRKIGFRLVVLTSCLLQSGSLMLSYLTIKRSFVEFLLTYSLLGGAGTGFGYSVVLAVAGSWFPKRRGLVVGIVVAGVGLGSFVFTPIQTVLINPDNIMVNNVTRQFSDEIVLNRLPHTLIILGCILCSIQAVGFVLLRSNTTKKFDDNTAITMASGEINLPPMAILKCIDFYLLWFIMVCSIIPITLINAVSKLYGQKYISSDQFLSIVATFSAVCNSIGRIIWGSIADHVSFKIPMCIMFTIWTAILLTFPHLHYLEGIPLMAAYAVSVFLLFFSFSGVFALMPVAVSTVFGHKFMAINYGLIFNSFTVGAMLCAVVVSQVQTTDNYLIEFTGCGIVTAIALFTLLWVEDRKLPSQINWLNALGRYCGGWRTQGTAELLQMQEVGKQPFKA